MQEIWNTFKEHGKQPHNRNKYINNNKYIKNHEHSYENVRNHVLETQEFKHENVDQKVGMLAKRKINIKV